MTNGRTTQTEFDSWNSYSAFAQRVRQNRRYVWDAEVQAFLNTVLATNRNRDTEIAKESIWWRAQLGVDYRTFQDIEEPVGFEEERMRPLRNQAREGRANSAGIPVLYLASELDTSIAEVRPWIGSRISVARFRVLRDLKTIDLSVKHGKTVLDFLSPMQLMGKANIDAETREDVVWSRIDNAFSEPVSQDESSADYVPTQILSELFMDAGYDAIAYRSKFGENGYNISVFDIDAAEIMDCTPYEVDEIEVRSGSIGNAWFKKKGD